MLRTANFYDVTNVNFFSPAVKCVILVRSKTANFSRAKFLCSQRVVLTIVVFTVNKLQPKFRRAGQRCFGLLTLISYSQATLTLSYLQLT